MYAEENRGSHVSQRQRHGLKLNLRTSNKKGNIIFISQN